MPILQIETDSIHQSCAKCSTTRTLPLSDLAIDEQSPGIVSLPPCDCGAVEYLISAPCDEVHSSPGSFGHLHRLLVDAIHSALESAESSAPLARRAASAIGAENVATWFPNGLRIEFPEQSTKKENQ
jgi:hypothetical protein